MKWKNGIYLLLMKYIDMFMEAAFQQRQEVPHRFYLFDLKVRKSSDEVWCQLMSLLLEVKFLSVTLQRLLHTAGGGRLCWTQEGGAQSSLSYTNWKFNSTVSS